MAVTNADTHTPTRQGHVVHVVDQCGQWEVWLSYEAGGDVASRGSSGHDDSLLIGRGLTRKEAIVDAMHALAAAGLAVLTLEP